MRSKPLYHTTRGQAYVGDSLDLLSELPANSIDLGKGDGSIYSGYPYELGTDTLHTFRRAKDWK